MKILLVDDSKSARYALRLQLQRHGVEVETAESAEAALQLLKGELPDAVLMDHMMPGLNGFEALELIRADPRTASLPVVMCTSNEDAEFAAAAQRRGALGILPKSVAAEKLPSILDQLKGLSRLSTVEAATPEVATAPSVAAPEEPTLDGRIDAHIDARLSRLVEPLLGDLRRDLRERLRTEVDTLVAAGVAEARAAFDTALAAERQALRARIEALEAEIEAVGARLAETTLPDLVKIEIEAERAQVMDLVEQYVQESRMPPAPLSNVVVERLAALEAAVAARAREGAKRDPNDPVVAAAERCQHGLDLLSRELRERLSRVYLAILGAALIGVLAAVGVYALVH
jgi:CheY-like chemotaxis protein